MYVKQKCLFSSALLYTFIETFYWLCKSAYETFMCRSVTAYLHHHICQWLIGAEANIIDFC